VYYAVAPGQLQAATFLVRVREGNANDFIRRLRQIIGIQDGRVHGVSPKVWEYLADRFEGPDAIRVAGGARYAASEISGPPDVRDERAAGRRSAAPDLSMLASVTRQWEGP
jgi:hypothetical protein